VAASLRDRTAELVNNPGGGPSAAVDQQPAASRPGSAERDAVAGLVEIARRLRPLIAGDLLPTLDDALARAQTGSVRVLVIGEAKRGKSTLVNTLFGADLLPTGALPLTSVATVVTTCPDTTAEARYLDGRVESIEPGDIAGLVSERGNPSNTKGVDQVRVTAPSPHLPTGIQVVERGQRPGILGLPLCAI
jgi:hypothetical protein